MHLHLGLAERHMASVVNTCLQASLHRTFTNICRMAEQLQRFSQKQVGKPKGFEDES